MHSDDTNQYEKFHLRATIEMIEAAIAQAASLADRAEESYQSTKMYMTENRGEIDPSENFQNELFLQAVDQQSAQAYFARERLAKLLDSPYFAKIVFRFCDGGDAAPDPIEVYIGRFAFNYQRRTIVSDWRSPVAGLFYDYDLGPAEYTAPSRTQSVLLDQKMQFKIEEGQLIYALDSAASIRDEILQLELSKTSDQKMHSIIDTIQKEQNRIIRNEDTGTLIIQGIAGSGKTSIALHRIAYLLYQKRDELSARSVAILSPNRVFSDYISNVLPELGEEPIKELCLADIFEEVLNGKIAVEPARFFVDTPDEKWRERAKYKGTFDFLIDLRDYLEQVKHTVFVGRDLVFGRHKIAGSYLEERYYSYPNLPVEERFDYLVSDIVLDLSSHTFALGIGGMPPRSKIRNELRKMLVAKDALMLYRQFFRDTGKPKHFVMPDKQTVEWEDAFPLALFQSFFGRLDDYNDIEHLVIDEMQDLTPVQHFMIKKLFGGNKTILGDYYQMIDPENTMNLAGMQSIYSNAQIVTLTKSYRSTLEIMDLAKRVKNIPELESVERHGKAPEIIRCGNTSGVLEQLEKLIANFEKSGHTTLGILHKSADFAERYYELLAQSHQVNLINTESESFEQGISISSVKMAKGLEFDEVIILDVDDTQYTDEDDRNLLYVAITRAMHELTILYRTTPSELLADH